MKTNFFQNITSLNLHGTWKLVIQTNADGILSVSELFNANCGDKAVQLIIPLTLTGTAQDLDEAFFDKITEPVSKSAELQTNLDAHLKSVDAAKAASKMEQDRKSKEKVQPSTIPKEDAELPEPKISREEKKKAYDEAMGRVSELIQKLKFSEALSILPGVEDNPNKENELKKKRQYLEQQASLYEKALINFNA